MAIRTKKIEASNNDDLITKLGLALAEHTDFSSWSYVIAETFGQLTAFLTETLVSVGAVAFTGSGLDDATSGGTYTGDTDTTFEAEIDSEGTPDTFQWRKGTEAWTTGVSMTGSPQLLKEGVTIDFAATTGHTSGESWLFSVMHPQG